MAFIRDVAKVGLGAAPGQYDRYNQRRMITITSNVSGQDLGGAAREVSEAIRRAGEAPRGVRSTCAARSRRIFVKERIARHGRRQSNLFA